MSQRLVVLLVLVPAVVLAACGSGRSVAAIEEELTERIPAEVSELGVDVSGVDCPDDASLDVGSTFECDVTAVENEQDVIYTATITIEAEDSVVWELTDVRLADG